MEEKIATDTIKYLYSIDDLLKNENGTENTLRQSILQRAKLIELRKDINLPKKNSKPRVKCPKCCMPRNRSLAEFRLQKKSISKFKKKLERKVEQESVLTKYQEKYLRTTKQKYDQIVEIRCKICMHKTKEGIKKPKINNKIQQKSDEVVKFENLQVKVGKKSKKSKQGKSKEKSKIKISKNKLNNRLNKKELIKSKIKIKDSKRKDLKDKKLSYKNNNKKLDKMNTLLSSSCKIKNTGLKDFIKSVI